MLIPAKYYYITDIVPAERVYAGKDVSLCTYLSKLAVAPHEAAFIHLAESSKVKLKYT